MPHIKINEPATHWEAPNSGDGPDESWKSVIVKTNANFAELFARLDVIEANLIKLPETPPAEAPAA